MATNQSTRLNHVSRISRACKQGLDVFRELSSIGADHMDVFVGEMNAEDFPGTTLAGAEIADIGAVLTVFAQLSAVLDANDGAGRKAIKRLAQFGG